MTPETVAILTNHDVIAVDQDAAGKQGDRVSEEGPIEVWAKPLADGSKAVGIFNRHQLPLTAHVDLSTLGLPGGAKAKDLWLNKDLGKIDSTITAQIPSHGVLLLRLSQ